MSLDGHAQRRQPRRQPVAVARANQCVVVAGRQQRGRRVGGGDQQRLGRAKIGCAAERRLGHRLVERQEVIGAGQADPAAHRLAVRAQPLRGERQHRRAIGPRRMAGEHQPVGIAMQRRGMDADPMHGGGMVAQEIGEADLGHQPIVGDGDDEAARRQRPADERVTLFRAAVPRPAIEEDDDRIAAGRLGRIDVERAARAGGEGRVVDEADGAAILGRQAVEQQQRRTGGGRQCQDRTDRAAPAEFAHQRRPAIGITPSRPNKAGPGGRSTIPCHGRSTTSAGPGNPSPWG